MTRRKAAPANSFGIRMRRMLDDREMAQADLAASLGVSSAYVSSLILDRRAPSAQTVEKIVDALQASSEERQGLHKAAAVANGFKLDLPEDF